MPMTEKGGQPKQHEKDHSRRQQEEEEEEEEKLLDIQLLRKLAREKTVNRRLQGALFAQRRTLRLLHQSAEDQESQAQIAFSHQHRREDERHLQRLQESVRHQDALLHQIRTVRGDVLHIRTRDKELDKEIRETREKLRVFNRQMDKVHVVGPEKVERRQEVLHQNYGRQLEENRRLVQHISHLQGQRDHVTQIRQELEKDSEKLSKELMDLVEKTDRAYDCVDRLNKQWRAQRTKLDRQQTGHCTDMDMWDHKMRDNRHIIQFIMVKMKTRPNPEAERRRHLQRQRSSQSEEDRKNCHTALDIICSELRQQNVHVIVDDFRRLKEENHKLYKMIVFKKESCQQVMDEIEEVKKLKQKIQDSRRQTQAELQASKEELLDKVTVCRKLADQQEESVRQADQVIEVYIQETLRILKKLGYTDQGIQKLTGRWHCVEERNIHNFLAELEQYVNKLHHVKSVSDFLVFRKINSLTLLPAVGPDRLPNLGSALPELPATLVFKSHDVNDDDDDAFRPLAFSEIKHYVEASLDAAKYGHDKHRHRAMASTPNDDNTSHTSEASPSPP